MKAYTKKFISIFLAITALINSSTLAAAYSKKEIADFGVIYVEPDTPGKYGYIADKFVDENGDEIEINPEEDELNCCSVESTPLPDSYDAREDNLITHAKNQGRTYNCWAFSTISAIESASITKGLLQSENTDFSEAHLAWFACNPNTTDSADGADGDGINYSSPYYQYGNCRLATGALARRSGAANEEAYPFGSIESMGNYGEEERHNISGGTILESAQWLTDENDIKSWIKTYGSVAVSFYYSDECYSSSKATYYCNTESSTNHQVTIIGWDDNYPASDFSDDTENIPAGDGAWICKNSWGSSWGDNGCFAISYFDSSISDFVGFSVCSADNHYNNYTHNGESWNNAIYIGVSEFAAANVYVAQGYEKLTSVSTYTFLPDTTLRIEIFKSIPENYSEPNEGKLVATLNYTADNSGFHTIYTDEKIELEPDEIFSIAVYYYHSGGNVKVPFEISTSSKSFHSDEKETYVYVEGYFNNCWTDSKNISLSGGELCNAMIQTATECLHPEKATEITEASSCSKEGSLSDICTQCGKTTGTKLISKTQHSFSEWSEYSHSTDTNAEICYRECSECGTVESKYYYANNSGHNIISLRDFLRFFFDRVFTLFRTF